MSDAHTLTTLQLISLYLIASMISDAWGAVVDWVIGRRSDAIAAAVCLVLPLTALLVLNAVF